MVGLLAASWFNYLLFHGLAICDKIVDRHGGRIWVESELGERPTFFLYVIGRTVMTQLRATPIEILLVEDNPADVRLTIEALKEAKVANRLSVVQDGVCAMEFLSSGCAAPGPDPAGPEPASQGRA